MFKHLIFSVLSGGFVLSGLSFAQAPVEPLKAPKAIISVKTPASHHFLGDSCFMADNVVPKSKKRLHELNRAIQAEMDSEAEKEDLLYPAVDLYGESSWGSEHVNPFNGIASVSIPDAYSIDCKDFTSPLDKFRRVNSHYGYRRRFHRMHYGVDLKLAVGDTVRAAFSGRVRLVSYERRGYGHYVVIRHPNGLETVYGHLSRTLVKPDQVINSGDPIALGGNSGHSTGPHLHFETRFMGIPLNPEALIDFSTGIPKSDCYVFMKGRSQNSKWLASRSRSGRRRIVATSDANEIQIYRIRRGDSLYKIARNNGLTVRQLCALNGITKRHKLIVGKTLRIS